MRGKRGAKDFLAEIVHERTRRNPAFPDLVKEAEARRKLARKLGPRVTHDPRANAAYVSLVNDIAPGEAVRQQVVGEDFVLDFDSAGKLLGIEVLDARRLLRESTLAGAGPDTSE
jgi:uncharacterized protein YuzE